MIGMDMSTLQVLLLPMHASGKILVSEAEVR